MRNLLALPGSRFVLHGAIAAAAWIALITLNNNVEPLTSYYLALAGMYATAMFGMTILVGLSGQVSLGNGALMAVGGYVFAITSLNWQTVPILGLPWNALWSMGFAAVGGVLVGLLIGGLAARLRGPYLAGLTLGVAVGIPAIANRFPELLGGENGLMLTVPYPEGGYATEAVAGVDSVDQLPTDQPSLATEQAPLAEEVTGEGDLLTLDDFGGGASDPAVEPSMAPSDLLTVDDVMEASAGPSADPGMDAGGIDAGGMDAGGLETADTGFLDGSFVLEHWQASLSVTVACILGFVALNLVRSRQGRVWQAVRDDSIAAAVSGISPAGSKVSAFVVSSLFASLAGAVFAQLLSYVGPGAFGLGLSLSLLVGIVLGGRASLLGAIIGAVLLVGMPVAVDTLSADRGWPEQVTNNAPNLLYGLLVVIVVLAAPGGVTGSIHRALAPSLRRMGWGTK
jgi:ABC-type branched-subunit amino acid transport system permease subunit